jgi:hypothetical protein
MPNASENALWCVSISARNLKDANLKRNKNPETDMNR